MPAKADQDTITIGVAIALTGRDAGEGRLTQEGYDFWRDYTNAHGGLTVGGKKYKVETKYYDDESSPQNSARLYEKLIDQDKVTVILSPYGSSATFTAAAVAERKKFPMVDSAGAAEKIFSTGNRYVFGILSPGKRYLTGILENAAALKPKPTKVAITATNDAFSLEAQAGAVEYAQTHGFDVVYQNKYPPDITNFATIVSAIKASNPDIILGAGHLQDSILMHKELKNQNVLAKIYGYSVGPATPDFYRTLAGDANYVTTGTQWSEDVKYKTQPSINFYKTSTEYANAFRKAYGRDPDYHNVEASAGCVALAEALIKAKSFDPEKLRESLASLDILTFFGIIKFDSRGLNVFKPMVVMQVQGGKPVTVWPAGVASKRIIVPPPPWGQR